MLGDFQNGLSWFRNCFYKRVRIKALQIFKKGRVSFRNVFRKRVKIGGRNFFQNGFGQFRNFFFRKVFKFEGGNFGEIFGAGRIASSSGWNFLKRGMGKVKSQNEVKNSNV